MEVVVDPETYDESKLHPSIIAKVAGEMMTNPKIIRNLEKNVQRKRG